MLSLNNQQNLGFGIIITPPLIYLNCLLAPMLFQDGYAKIMLGCFLVVSRIVLGKGSSSNQ